MVFGSNPFAQALALAFGPRSGLFDRGWGLGSLALVALALLGAAALIGVERVRRKPIALWPFFALACLPLLTGGGGSARFGVAATVLGAVGAAHALLLLGRWRRPARWPVLLAVWVACGLAGGWLGWAVGGWAALAVAGVALSALPLGWRPLGPPSRLRTAAAIVPPAVAALLVVQILAYVSFSTESDSVLFLPPLRTWALAVPALAAVLLPAVLTRHPAAAVSTTLASLALVWCVAPPPRSTGMRLLAADLIAPVNLRIQQRVAPGAELVAPGAPAWRLGSIADRGGAVVVRAGERRRHRDFGRIELLPWAPGKDAIPLRGTVGDVLSRCEDYCAVVAPTTPARVSAASAGELAAAELARRLAAGRTDGLHWLAGRARDGGTYVPFDPAGLVGLSIGDVAEALAVRGDLPPDEGRALIAVGAGGAQYAAWVADRVPMPTYLWTVRPLGSWAAPPLGPAVRGALAGTGTHALGTSPFWILVEEGRVTSTHGGGSIRRVDFGWTRGPHDTADPFLGPGPSPDP